MRDAFQLSYALIPYIYTAARRACDSGVSPVHPLYYDWPETVEAYAFPNEYRFGEDLVVSPVVSPLRRPPVAPDRRSPTRNSPGPPEGPPEARPAGPCAPLGIRLPAVCGWRAMAPAWKPSQAREDPRRPIPHRARGFRN